MEDPEMNTFRSPSRPIEVRHLSEHERRIIRERIKKQNRQSHRKTLSISILLFSIAFMLIYIGSLKLSEGIRTKEKDTAEKLLEEKRAVFSERIQKGDFLVSQSLFGEAIFQYKNAVDLFPDSYKANTRLANAYMKSCLNNYTYCNEGKKHLDRIISLYPKDVNLLEIRASLYIAAGEPEKANRDFEMINEILAKD